MRRNLKIITLLFGTMLFTASCQKIDDDLLGKENNTQTNNKDADNSENDKSSTTQQDGTSQVSNYNQENNTLETSEHAALLYMTNDGDALLKSELTGTETLTSVLYISLMEWQLPTFNNNGAGEALALASTYREGNVTGWRLPTYNEVVTLKGKYDVKNGDSSLLEELNTSIEAVNGMPFYNKDEKSNNKYFLCLKENTTNEFYKYNFLTTYSKPNGTIGKTVTYYLRLVASVSLAE